MNSIVREGPLFPGVEDQMPPEATGYMSSRRWVGEG